MGIARYCGDGWNGPFAEVVQKLNSKREGERLMDFVSCSLAKLSSLTDDGSLTVFFPSVLEETRYRKVFQINLSGAIHLKIHLTKYIWVVCF